MTVHRGDMLDSPAGAEGRGECIDLHRVAGSAVSFCYPA